MNIEINLHDHLIVPFQQWADKNDFEWDEVYDNDNPRRRNTSRFGIYDEFGEPIFSYEFGERWFRVVEIESFMGGGLGESENTVTYAIFYDDYLGDFEVFGEHLEDVEKLKNVEYNGFDEGEYDRRDDTIDIDDLDENIGYIWRDVRAHCQNRQAQIEEEKEMREEEEDDDDQLDEKFNVLEEGFKDKITKLEKDNIEELTNYEKVLIQKRENTFNWEEIFNSTDPLHQFRVNVDGQLNSLLFDNTEIKSNKNLLTFLSDLRSYYESNNYENAFVLMFVNDFIKKYKTNKAVPTFKTYVFGGIYTKFEKSTAMGNLVKEYLKLDKEDASKKSSPSGEIIVNQWVVIPSRARDSENYEENLNRLQTYSQCKTGWCVRDKGMAERYLPESNFHLYIDGEGDAVVSLRINSEDYIEEISGTENGSNQHVSDEYKQHTIDYVNKNSYDIEDERSYYFEPQTAIDLIEEYDNESLVGYINGDVDIDALDVDISDSYDDYDVQHEDFPSDTRTDDKKIAEHLRGYGLEIDEDGDYDGDMFNELLSEFMEAEYEQSITSLVNMSLEASTRPNVIEWVSDMVGKMVYDGVVKFVGGDEDKDYLFRVIEAGSKDDVVNIEDFFQKGQPQIQEVDDEFSPHDYIHGIYMEELFGDIGFEFDHNTYLSVIQEHIPKEFYEKFRDEDYTDVKIKYIADDDFALLKRYVGYYEESDNEKWLSGMSGFIINNKLYVDKNHDFVGKLDFKTIGKLVDGDLNSGDTFKHDLNANTLYTSVIKEDAFEITIV